MAKKRDGLFKRGNVWHVRTDPVDGKQRSTGCATIEAARLWLARQERLAADPAAVGAEEAEFGTWAAEVVRLHAAKPVTARYYQQKLQNFVNAWGADRKLSTITPGLLDAYVKARRADGISEHTLSKEWSALVQVLAAAKHGECFARDIESLKPLDVKTNYRPRKRALAMPEVTSLRATLRADREALVALIVGSGARLSEALGMLPEDIDLAAGTIHIPGTKTNESERTIPIFSVYRELLVFARPYLPLTWKRNVVAGLGRACRRAGIDRCGPNDLRRTFASILRARGVDPDLIRRCMGHTTRAMVDSVYAQMTPGEIGALAEKSLREEPNGTTDPGINRTGRLGDLQGGHEISPCCRVRTDLSHGVRQSAVGGAETDRIATATDGPDPEDWQKTREKVAASGERFRAPTERAVTLFCDSARFVELHACQPGREPASRVGTVLQIRDSDPWADAPLCSVPPSLRRVAA